MSVRCIHDSCWRRRNGKPKIGRSPGEYAAVSSTHDAFEVPLRFAVDFRGNSRVIQVRGFSGVALAGPVECSHEALPRLKQALLAIPSSRPQPVLVRFATCLLERSQDRDLEMTRHPRCHCRSRRRKTENRSRLIEGRHVASTSAACTTRVLRYYRRPKSKSKQKTYIGEKAAIEVLASLGEQRNLPSPRKAPP